MKSIFTSLVLLFLASTVFGQSLSEKDITITMVSNINIYTLKSDKKPLEGEYSILKRNGNKYEASFKKGKINGKFQQYNKEGIILFSQNYSKGILDGVQTLFYPNGKIMETFTFKKGKIDGTAKVYDKDGKVIHEKEFIKGIEIKEPSPPRPTPARQ